MEKNKYLKDEYTVLIKHCRNYVDDTGITIFKLEEHASAIAHIFAESGGMNGTPQI